MSPGSSRSESVETLRTENTSLGSSKQPDTTPAAIKPTDNEEMPDGLESNVHSATTGDVGDGDGIDDGAKLSEIRKSLHTISNGVEELATTVQDFFGLSDSDESLSDDHDCDSDGQWKLSWTKMKNNARKRRRRRLLKKNSPGIDSLKSDSESDEDSKKGPEIIADVRECNLEHFQSRPAGDSQKLYCLDVLTEDDERDDLDDDIRDFRETVADIDSGKLQYWKPNNALDSMGGAIPEGTGKKCVRRVRINSRAVLTVIRSLCSNSFQYRIRPIVFYRPFQLLVTMHTEIKEQLVKMRGLGQGSSSDERIPTASNTVLTPSHDGHGSTQDLSNDESAIDESAIDELTCFVDFMEDRIMPDSRRYRESSSPPPQTIRYDDLWYLYKPGDLVYLPRHSSAQHNSGSTGSSQQVVRIIQTRLTQSMPVINPIGVAANPNVPWSLLCHFIEHNGDSYTPIHIFSDYIIPFRGQKKVTELPAYPLSYLEDDQVIPQAILDGEKYVNLIERRSGFYSGWTQTVNPFGIPTTDNSPEGRQLSPEHIESDILVDFQETFNAIPHWKPFFYPGIAHDGGIPGHTLYLHISNIPILEWDEAGQTVSEVFDHALVRDGTEDREALKFMRDDMLGQFREHTRKAPTGEFLALLPRRFFAYAVLERRFVQLNTRFVHKADLESNNKAFEKLEIKRDYKRLILALVKSHFDKVETEKKRNVEIGTQDLIRGKGKGVVILLHGVPGVGKTATAEAVALKWKKPLFPITCGDLGYTAESLEKSLNEIFRLAHHWGCILLLDEADVFITQRERRDLKRNALVSGENQEIPVKINRPISKLMQYQAFLRVLEYYNGIMFLTTNRAGVLDEAVKSRVHLNLHYDHLTEDQTVAIFKLHIQRLRDIERQRNPDENEQIKVVHKEIIQFARDHFNQGSNTQGSGSNLGRWNGRQIRNAFLIASSLAHYDSEDEGDEDMDDLAEPGRKTQKQLGRSQFETVAKTTLMYDQYRQMIYGTSDDQVAYEREERAKVSQPRSPTPDRMKKDRMSGR